MRMGGSPLLLVGAIVLLAALDFVGSVLAKEWATEPLLGAVGGGLLLVERIRYEVVLPNGKLAAIVAILALQAYLVLAPNGEAP